MCDHIVSHSEEQILKGCISLIDEMVGNFREYLEFIGHEPEFDEEKQPFVDADTGWILVEDKLPEEEQDVLATYIDNEETRIIPVNYARGTWFDCIFNYALNPLKVIAWCRLPKAYKPKEDK